MAISLQPKSQSKLKVGFLVDSSAIEQNSLDLMDAIASNELFFESPAIIDLAAEEYSFVSFISKFKSPFKFLLTKIIHSLEASRIRNNPVYRDYFLKHSSSSILSIRPSFIKSNINSLHEQKIDIFIHSCSLKIPEFIFNQSKYGVIKSHNQEPLLDQELFVGFLDVLSKRSVSSLALIRQTIDSRLDSLICSGKIMTRSTWHHNRAAILKKRNAFILIYLKDLHSNGLHEEDRLDQPDLINHEDKISSFYLLKYIFGIYLRLAYFTLKSAFQISKKYNRWHISYIKSNDLQPDLSSAVEVKNLPGRFFADPFIIRHEGRTICFVEDFFFDQSKGKISAIEIFENKYKFLDIVLEEDFHLSYPYIFVENGQVYMIPETSQAREIRLYQATNFPIKWELKEVLMKNISAVDTAVFKQENLWFMLTNICSSDSDDHSSELHIFYSEELISKQWTPIKKSNPVIFNAQRARNGGFFEIKDKKYRVNQVQGFSHYGEYFSVNLIKDISINNYEEEKVFEIKPNYMKEIISTHHYHTNGDYIVFDYCKIETIT